jgi:hypothetical protein
LCGLPKVCPSAAATGMLRSGMQQIYEFLLRNLVSRPKMGYAFRCVEDKNETSGEAMGHHRRTGLHP